LYHRHDPYLPDAPKFFTLTAAVAAGVSGVMLGTSRPLMHLLDPSRL
jgi:hypothetical protein